MSSPVRRSRVLALLMAVVLAVSGLAAPVVLGAKPLTTTVRGIDVDATTIPELQAHMDAGRLTSAQLTRFYLQRIRRLNPELNAVIRISPKAIADAQAADRARRRGVELPLLGIPVIVKDNINTTGMATTAGSYALKGSRPSDAFIVERIKAAGGIIIGKANLSEWANFRSAPSSSGWSGIGGQTNMAHVLDRNPCGSSSGSGVVAAADLATVAVGTETDGSIVCPAGANGIVGIKPTVGLLSREGIIPITADQDTAGPMTRNVTDAAVLLGVMTGVDPADPATAAQAGNAFSDYTQFLDDEALDGARIGVWRTGTYNELTAAIVEPILDDAVAALAAEGATIVDPIELDLSAAGTHELNALLCEFKTDIASYLQTYTAKRFPKTLADLIEFNNEHPRLESGAPESDWNQLIFDFAEATGGRDDACADIRAALTPPTQAEIDGVMAELDLDAIVALTNGPAWETNPVLGDLDGDFSRFVGSSTPAAVAGYGSITVPAGYVGPLPIGVSFIGGAWSEPELIGIAYDFEQATQVREPPQFLESTDVPVSVSAAGPNRRSVAPERRGVGPVGGGRWSIVPLR